uniref:Uncharacterized protein n=1 Tax=Chrysotila carterae TaxID=13221 RepID=A0A7S4BHQ1_CHRCT
MSAKKFEMPGQTKELDMSAADAEALRIFYSTLHTQRPESEMASKWLLQHGLLERDEAEQLSKLLLKNQKKPSSTGSKPAAKRPVNFRLATAPVVTLISPSCLSLSVFDPQVASDDDFKAAPPKKKAATNGKKATADSSDAVRCSSRRPCCLPVLETFDALRLLIC